MFVLGVRVGQAVNMLQHLSYATPAGIYWGYLCARAQALRLPTEKPATWAFGPGVRKYAPQRVTGM